MPTYEYACQCGHQFEQEQRITEPALETCPVCKETKCKNWKKNKGCKVERVINATGFVLKGGGWYKDGYGSSKGPSTSTAVPPASSTSTETKAPETKPAESSSKKESTPKASTKPAK